jgi:phytoene/squalene synthetase
MTDATATLARSITRVGSKQTYYTARLLVDRELVNDFFRAFAYFRWADDIIDVGAPVDSAVLAGVDTSGGVSSQSRDDCISFIKRQSELIDRVYNDERPDDLTPEEEIIADLISHSQDELMWYSDTLAKSVTDGIRYFVGNGHRYPATDDSHLAATTAHIAHLLRDMSQDTVDGFINIPREYLVEHGISQTEADSPAFRAWVHGQVEQAQQYFDEGKRYLDGLNVMRCIIAGYWYSAWFEGVLDTIERDGFVPRSV